MVESIARVRHIRVTPQKARRVVALIKGKQAQEALAILKFAQQSASEPIYKLVASAMANAQVKADRDGEFLDEKDLYVANAYVDEGTTLKRFQPRAQGRAFQIKKRTSHITVVLSTPEAAPAAAGDSNKAIARALDLSPHTVKRHVANILGKLGATSRVQAAALARSTR